MTAQQNYTLLPFPAVLLFETYRRVHLEFKSAPHVKQKCF